MPAPKKGEIKQAPGISLLGVVEEGAEKAMIERLQKQLMKALNETEADVIMDDDALQELTRLAVRRIINALRGKKPTVVTHVVAV